MARPGSASSPPLTWRAQTSRCGFGSQGTPEGIGRRCNVHGMACVPVVWWNAVRSSWCASDCPGVFAGFPLIGSRVGSGLRLGTSEECDQRLRSPQIEKCKARLRDSIKFCDDAEGDKSIPKDAFDEDGELEAAAIFCAKCLSKESHDVRSPDHNGSRRSYEQDPRP